MEFGLGFKGMDKIGWLDDGERGVVMRGARCTVGGKVYKYVARAPFELESR